ncbi:hypothetical protein [Shewanella youngdeokensis]|uniref:Uncharacterized protein n=1 Tax=Shewanella youngdeokensis TaxID=2999068 RepID=A0ABZ0K486_9GAMM|nr:hypothetical protein RGE70_08115 [Shewanella sp. DAU334]
MERIEQGSAGWFQLGWLCLSMSMSMSMFMFMSLRILANQVARSE